MSTLDVACARCDKRFRVRAEFAGKATRCPGCSAPITIGGPAPPRRPERPSAPGRGPSRGRRGRRAAPRGRRLGAGGHRPGPRAGGGRIRPDHAAVRVPGLLPLRAAEGTGGVNEAVLVLALLLLVGPAPVSATFGLTARVAALRSPAAVSARGRRCRASCARSPGSRRWWCSVAPS